MNRTLPKARGVLYNHSHSGCGSVRLEHTVRDREIGGSNPLAPTFSFKTFKRLEVFVYMPDNCAISKLEFSLNRSLDLCRLQNDRSFH
jgi:hypothetical protein